MDTNSKFELLGKAISLVDADTKKHTERLDNLTKFCEGLLSMLQNQEKTISKLTEELDKVKKLSETYVSFIDEIVAHGSDIKQIKADLAGINRRAPTSDRAKKRSFTYEMWERIQQLKATGASVTSISGMVNVPRSSVGKYIRMTEEEAQKLPHDEQLPDALAPDNSVKLDLEEMYG